MTELFMYVCLCKGITDNQIKQAVEAGAQSFRDVRKSLGVATQCGKCACFANGIIQDKLKEQDQKADLFYAIA